MKTIRLMMSLAAAALPLAACHRASDTEMLGTLEWDRVAVAAEVSEPILRITVHEGDSAHAGDLILSLDPRRTDAELAQATADARKAEAALAELRHGTRIETIDASRATLAGAQSTEVNARRERDRLAEIRKRGLIAQADLDNAETALRTATAQSNNARANLAELLNGTRIEDIDQAEAALASAQAAVDHLTLTRARLDVRAPANGRVDALPFKLGDQPPLTQHSSACSRVRLPMRAFTCPRASARVWTRARIAAYTCKASRRNSPRRSAACARIRHLRPTSR